jgi:hypothetical protein
MNENNPPKIRFTSDVVPASPIRNQPNQVVVQNQQYNTIRDQFKAQLATAATPTTTDKQQLISLINQLQQINENDMPSSRASLPVSDQ